MLEFRMNQKQSEPLCVKRSTRIVTLHIKYFNESLCTVINSLIECAHRARYIEREKPKYVAVFMTHYRHD